MVLPSKDLSRGSRCSVDLIDRSAERSLARRELNPTYVSPGGWSPPSIQELAPEATTRGPSLVGCGERTRIGRPWLSRRQARFVPEAVTSRQLARTTPLPERRAMEGVCRITTRLREA